MKAGIAGVSRRSAVVAVVVAVWLRRVVVRVAVAVVGLAGRARQLGAGLMRWMMIFRSKRNIVH
jgi:hypothetical protein